MAAYRWMDDLSHLPVHRDQLRAQRSVTSMGNLYLFTHYPSVNVGVILGIHAVNAAVSTLLTAVNAAVKTGVQNDTCLDKLCDGPLSRTVNTDP